MYTCICDTHTHRANKNLVSNIYKEFPQCNSKRTVIQLKKWAKDFMKFDQKGNANHKKRLHTPRMSIIKKKKSKVGKNVKAKKIPYTAGGNVKSWKKKQILI